VRGDVQLFQFPRPDKRRPVVVLTRNASIGRLSTVTVARITSAIRGIPSEVRLDEQDGMKGVCVVNLHGAITIPQQLLGRRVAQLGPQRMSEICLALLFSVGCDAQ
jgi:mRNA interferase MazF